MREGAYVSSIKCAWCPNEASVELQPTIDGIACEWDRYCLSCAERYVVHWREGGVTWAKRQVSP